MITSEFIDSLGIDKEKADALKAALRKDSFYRNLLYKAGVFPGTIEEIMRVTDTSNVDEAQGKMLEEKIKIEWACFIPEKRK